MQPFESVDCAESAACPPHHTDQHAVSPKSSRYRPSGGLPPGSFLDDTAAASIFISPLPAAKTHQVRHSQLNTSPTRSPQRACSPQRAHAVIDGALRFPHTKQTTQVAPHTAGSSSLMSQPRVLQPIPTRTKAHHISTGPTAMDGSKISSPSYTAEMQSTGAPTKAGVLVDMEWWTPREQRVVVSDPPADVTAIDYITSCADIKLIARERDESFPRCCDIPAELRIPCALLQRVVMDDGAVDTRHGDGGQAFDGYSCCARGRIGRVVVSQVSPSAARCVIPDAALVPIVEQYFTALPSSSSSGQSPFATKSPQSPPLWIDDSGDLVMDLRRLSMPLARHIAFGSHPPLRFQLPFFVEDVSDVSIGEDGVLSTTKSPMYHVDVLIGCSSRMDDAPPSLKDDVHAGSTSTALRGMRAQPTTSHAAKKLHKAVREGHSNKNKHALSEDADNAEADRERDSAAEQPPHHRDAQHANGPPVVGADGLPCVPIHTFRPLPHLIAPCYVGATYVLSQPLSFLRAVSDLGERRMLRKDLLVRREDKQKVSASASPPPTDVDVKDTPMEEPPGSDLTQQGRLVDQMLEHPPLETLPRGTVVLSSEEATRAVGTLIRNLEDAVSAVGSAPSSNNVQQLLLQLVPLLSQVGGQESLEKAASLARLRVQLQCRSLGLSEKSLVGPAEALPLQSLAGGLIHMAPHANDDDNGGGDVQSPTSQLRFVASLLLDQLGVSELLVQYTVECAHLHKHLGQLREALRWYRVGLLVANLLRGKASSHHQQHGPRGMIKRGMMIPDDETGLLPFIRAIGDISTALGNVQEAISAYELARAFSEMKSRISLGAATPASGGDHHHSADDSDVLLHPQMTQTLEYDASLAVVATLGHQQQTAQTAFHRCEKALEDSLVFQRLMHFAALAEGVAQLSQVPVDIDVDTAIEHCETAVDILAHLAFCCVARDAFRQGRKYLEQAFHLLDLAEALIMTTHATEGADARGVGGLLAPITTLRGGLHIIRGMSYMRRSILSDASTSESGSTSTMHVRSRDDPSSVRSIIQDDDDEDEDELDASTSAAIQLLSKASTSFRSAALAYRDADPADAPVLITMALWLHHCCCTEEEDINAAARIVADEMAQRYVLTQHPLFHCVALTVALLDATEWKANAPFADCPSEHLALRLGFVLNPIRQFARRCGVHPEVVSDDEAVRKSSSAPSQQSRPLTHRTLLHVPPRSLSAQLLFSGEGTRFDLGSVPLLSLSPHHPLLYVLWELSAVCCALVDFTEVACACLDLAAGVLVRHDPLLEKGRDASNDEPDEGASPLLPFLRRDATLTCRRVTPLIAFCLTSALHRRNAQTQPLLLHATLPIERSARLLEELVKDLGLDGIRANSGQMPSSPNHNVGPTLRPTELPGLFLDMAEVRLCLHDTVGCLESCSRAIRLSDERNLLYLLGPLFKPAFHLTIAETEDRTRLLRERQLTASSDRKGPHAEPLSWSILMLGLSLFTLARAHEVGRNFAQSFSVYLQCYAALEMTGLSDQPVAAEALVGCSRTSLQLGNLGDGMMYADLALELFETHHCSFGAFRATPLLVELKDTMDHCRRTAGRMTEDRNYTLTGHEAQFVAPSLNGFPLYM